MTEIRELSWPLLGLVSARMGGMLFAAPFWGARVVSFRFRLAICLILSLSIVPLVGQNTTIEFTTTGQYINQVIGELLGGMIFGLGIHVVFKAMMVAGELIGVPLGLRVNGDPAAAVDTGQGSTFLESSSATGKLFDVVAMITFVLIGGPMFMIDAIVQSTVTQPVGSFSAGSESIQQILQVVPASFLLGLKIALPITVCQLLALLTIGIISRSLPQVSMFQVGMPLAMSVTLIAILFAIGSITILFGDQIESVSEQLVDQFWLPASEPESAAEVPRQLPGSVERPRAHG